MFFKTIFHNTTIVCFPSNAFQILLGSSQVWISFQLDVLEKKKKNLQSEGTREKHLNWFLLTQRSSSTTPGFPPISKPGRHSRDKTSALFLPWQSDTMPTFLLTLHLPADLIIHLRTIVNKDPETPQLIWGTNSPPPNQKEQSTIFIPAANHPAHAEGSAPVKQTDHATDYFHEAVKIVTDYRFTE